MRSYETDLPTQQEEETTQMRLSQTDEDSLRKVHPQSPTQAGKKTLSSLRFSFSKSARILKRSHYQTIFRTKEKWTGRYLLIDFRKGVTFHPKLGITVTRRFGKAYVRNHFKRLVREAFRLQQREFPHDLEMNVLPLYNKQLEKMQDALCDFKTFIQFLTQCQGKRSN